MKSNWILFLSNASVMMSMIFIPLFADLVGASRMEIGIIGASYGMAIFFSSYFFSRASDMRDKRTFLKAGLFIAAVAFFLQVFANSSLSLTIVRGIAGFAIGIFTAPLIVYTYESGGKLGMFSSYGALGWAVGGMLAGIIGQLAESVVQTNSLAPYWAVFVLSSVLFFVSLLISLDLPEVRVRPTNVPLFPAALIKKNLWVYASMFLRNSGAFAIWTIFPIFLMELGANKFWIGALFFVNTYTQYIIMRRLDIKSDALLIKAGMLLSGLVFFSYSLATKFYFILPSQIVLAFSYSFVYVGSLLYLTRTNEERTTSVGILNSVISLSMVIGPLLGGAISQVWGFRAVMHFAGGITFIGLLISLILSPKSS
jgi:MFS family permease